MCMCARVHVREYVCACVRVCMCMCDNDQGVVPHAPGAHQCRDVAHASVQLGEHGVRDLPAVVPGVWVAFYCGEGRLSLGVVDRG